MTHRYTPLGGREAANPMPVRKHVRTKSITFFCVNYKEPPDFCECLSHFWSPDLSSWNHLSLFPLSAHVTSPVDPTSKMALGVISLSSSSPLTSSLGILPSTPNLNSDYRLILLNHSSVLLTNSFSAYSLNIYYVPRTVLSPGDTFIAQTSHWELSTGHTAYQISPKSLAWPRGHL